MHISNRDLERQPQFDPIRVKGGLQVTLFGLTIARIGLNLDITSLTRLAQVVTSRIAVQNDDRDEGGDLSTLSRSALYQLARKEHVVGRSAMTRGELISALATPST